MGFLAGKRAVVVGVASNRSIAWGIARAAAAQGAQIALTWQGDALRKRVEPLAAEVAWTSTPNCSPTGPRPARASGGPPHPMVKEAVPFA